MVGDGPSQMSVKLPVCLRLPDSRWTVLAMAVMGQVGMLGFISIEYHP